MVRIDTLTGQDVAQHLDALAQLRITVFHDFPYLYAGTLDYEQKYLRHYINSQESVVVGAFDGDQLIGASTGTPLSDHADEFGKALAGIEIDHSNIFYLAESVLLPAYRGTGLGHKFFEAREAHAMRLGFSHAAFCAVIRPDDHPMKPADYRPLDAFWSKCGYRLLEGAIAQFAWTDIGDAQQSEKPMQFWIKAL